jgi:hypothetical protein
VSPGVCLQYSHAAKGFECRHGHPGPHPQTAFSLQCWRRPALFLATPPASDVSHLHNNPLPCVLPQALEAELLPALAGICFSAQDPATASATLRALAALLQPLDSSGDAAGGSVDAWVASQQQQQQRNSGFGNNPQQQKPGGRNRQWQEEEGEEEEEQETGRYMQQQRQQDRAGRRGPGAASSWQQEQEQGPGMAVGRGSPTKAPQQSSGRAGGGVGGGPGAEAGAVDVAALGRCCSAGSVAAGMELLGLAGEDGVGGKGGGGVGRAKQDRSRYLGFVGLAPAADLTEVGMVWNGCF